jgi:hypothetical protein
VLDVFSDVIALYVPQVEVSRGISGRSRRSSPSWRGSAYIRGPLPLSWWESACSLSGPKVLSLSLAVWFLQGLRDRMDGLELSTVTLERFGVVGGSSKSRALAVLEEAGLLQVVRSPGKNPFVSITGPVGMADGWVSGGFIQGPLPLRWWGTACGVAGGKATLATALAIWFQAGLNRARGELPLTTAMVGRFGVTPSGKSRALAALQAAGLIRLQHRGRKNPLVTLLKDGDALAA